MHHGGGATLELKSDSHMHRDGSTGVELKGGAQARHDRDVAIGLGGAAGTQLGNAEGRPLAAAVQLLLGGGSEPVQLGPLSIDLGRVQLQPDLELRFKLFGRHTLFTVNLRGTSRLGPDER